MELDKVNILIHYQNVLWGDRMRDRGLLVTYTTGGITPGDSYLWILDKNGLPKEWRLWISNVPIGGLKFSWDGWISMNNTWSSTSRESPIFDLKLTNLVVR